MTQLSPRTEKYLANPAALCNIVRRIALGAGEIILDYYDGLKDADITIKDDGSPVSLADQEAEAYIKKELHGLMPEIPFVGEETVSAGDVPDLSGSDFFWLVDPLDGTREFAEGGDEFTVNIALVYQGSPAMGVVYVPVTGVLYAGYADTALRWNEDTGKEKPIAVRPLSKKGLVVVTSKTHGSSAKLEAFLHEFKVQKWAKRASSLKMCMIAEGKADIYPRLGDTCEWDTAAADAILRAAGGMITDLNGEPLTYGGARPKFLNPEFVAASFEWYKD